VRINFAIILVGVLLGGCVIIPPYNIVDFGKTADGKPYIRDTPRTWAHWKEVYGKAIDAELHGQELYGGMKSWNQNWLRVIRSIRSGQENPEKYVAYIVERRRELGLPEIVFPAPETPSPR